MMTAASIFMASHFKSFNVRMIFHLPSEIVAPKREWDKSDGTELTELSIASFQQQQTMMALMYITSN